MGTLACMGDSLTFANGGNGITMAESWPYLVKKSLGKLGYTNIVERNHGISGNTAAQMLARFGAMKPYIGMARSPETPKVAVLWSGTNELPESSTVNGGGATATVIPVQTGYGQYYGTSGVGAGGWVTINGQSVQVASVSVDTLTLASALSAAPTSGTGVNIDTRKSLVQMGKNLVAGQTLTGVLGAGVGHAQGDTLTLANGATISVVTVGAGGAITQAAILTAPTNAADNPVGQVSTTGAGTGATFGFTGGCNRILIMGNHYRNFTPGGDTTSVQDTTTAAIRTLQQGAVSDLQALGINAVYVDNYNYMRNLILSGAETQNSNCWHILPGNLHPNSVRTRALVDGNNAGKLGGNEVIAANVAAVILAQGWANILNS